MTFLRRTVSSNHAWPGWSPATKVRVVRTVVVIVIVTIAFLLGHGWSLLVATGSALLAAIAQDVVRSSTRHRARRAI